MSRWDDLDRESNPFYDEDTTLGNRGIEPNRTDDYGNSYNPEESRRDQLLKKIKESEERQLASQQRALGHLYESERMGIATAEELVRQGEQLDNVENKTTEINQTMKTTQKHITSIRSVFGGLKNWISGKKEESSSNTATPQQKKPSKLNEMLDNYTNESSSHIHPAIRLREEDNVDAVYGESESSALSRSGKNEEIFQENLGMMSDNLSRLKNLGMAMNDTVGSQNEQLDRLNESVDKADTTLTHQNRQMRNILYK